MAIASSSSRHAHRSPVDALVAHVAQRMLRWADREADRPGLAPAEVELLRSNARDQREASTLATFVYLGR
ncbi:hypothetical protein [Glaciihabitans sp. dw_435]|uniref:hypothetical protein n=1 Tax=Glaciihabitans sp. dw_435 TaxID=2720081 RepID=UPI001BD49DD7|nr:hypothetical protein [Glaciihabitans sp. dw_435]